MTIQETCNAIESLAGSLYKVEESMATEGMISNINRLNAHLQKQIEQLSVPDCKCKDVQKALIIAKRKHAIDAVMAGAMG
jgi:hypothetical protein